MGCPGPDFDSDLCPCDRCGDPVVVDVGDEPPDSVLCLPCKAIPPAGRYSRMFQDHPTPALGTETMWDVVKGKLR